MKTSNNQGKTYLIINKPEIHLDFYFEMLPLSAAHSKRWDKISIKYNILLYKHHKVNIIYDILIVFISLGINACYLLVVNSSDRIQIWIL